MKDPVEIQKELIALEEKLNRQLEEQKEKAKADIIKYIIARFNEVSYAKQPLHLKSKTKEHPLKDKDGNVILFGSDTPCRNWDVMGIKKTVSESIEDRRNGKYYTGEIRYYVERLRKYRPSDDFKKSVFRIDKDCQLSYDDLLEVAYCLKGYHRNVHMYSNWNGWYYDRD